MKLHGANGELEGNARGAWIIETQERIWDETSLIIENEGYGLDVSVVLDHQEVLEGRRVLRMGVADLDESVESETHLRRLQSASPLQLNFTTTIKFNSDEEDWDANKMVAAGFQSLANQKKYIYSLKAADYAFEDVENMSMEVDGVLITATLITNTEDSNDNTLYYIIGGAVGGGLLLLMIGAIIYTRKRREGTSSSPKASPQDAPSGSRSTGQASHPPPASQAYYQDRPQLPPMPPAQNYFGTIETGEDDVSTLGDPYFGEGVVNSREPRADDTVAESMISSELEMFGVGRHRLNTGGGSTLPGSTVNGRMMFGDDPTLEDAFGTPEYDASNSRGNNGEGSSFQRLVVMAPAGKLGVVIDNPMGDLPIVHAIKETSALHGRVNVGDLLISMDEIDCRGFSAVQVSRLISSRSNNPARTLVLLRGGC